MARQQCLDNVRRLVGLTPCDQTGRIGKFSPGVLYTVKGSQAKENRHEETSSQPGVQTEHRASAGQIHTGQLIPKGCIVEHKVQLLPSKRR